MLPALGLFAIVILVSGCVPDRVISSTTEMKGDTRANMFTLKSSADIELVGDLKITAVGDILIEGTIQSSKNKGHSVSLVSEKGNIVITGGIVGDRGANGASTNNSAGAFGDNGQDGGSVELRAAQGSVTISGNLTGGMGGTGGMANTGNQDELHVRADGGAGGEGGRIVIFAARDIIVEATIESGMGNISGTTTSTNTSTDERADSFAFSKRSGNGGDIEIESWMGNIRLIGAASIESGSGNFSGGATAKGISAYATSVEGGDGGSISLKVSAGHQVVAGSVITTGKGRNSGAAIAEGKILAEARGGAGGVPGVLLNNTAGTRGEADDSGMAKASLADGTSKMMPSKPASGVRPGGATVAQVP